MKEFGDIKVGETFLNELGDVMLKIENRPY